MAPRQVIPYDEGGGRASRQLFVETHHQQQQRRHQQQQRQQQPWADPAAALENEPPSSCFAPQAIGRREDIGHRQDQQLHSSDLRDALGDEDDEDEDGDESVELGAPTHWAGRDLAPKPPGVEIFVGGLTRSTRRDMLRDWFQHAGEVTEVRIARDKRRRRCRGYGYVRFSTSDEANRAIDTMHRFEFKHGRFLGVLPSDENRTLFVGGLKEEWSCAYICQLLKEKMPGLRKVEPIPDREDPFKIRTFCFLEFASHAEAAAIFDRHQTSPKPAPRAPSAAAPPTQHAFPPLHGPEAAGGVDLRAPPTARAGGAGAGIDNGGELFFERDARDGSTSTGDTSGGEFFATAAATAAAGGAASSPDLDGEDPGDGLFRFEASSLGSVWGQRHLCLDSEDRGDGDRGGGGGLGASDGGFLSWGDTPAAPTATTAAISADNGGDLVTGDPEGGGNGGGAGATTTVGVPLVVGGATLKVDWADPLRYHIHLNGGIKGPSAPPEFGMPDGRLSSRGGGGGGCGRTVSGNAGCGRAGSGNGGGGGVPRGGGGFGVARSWQQQQQHQEQHQGLSRHPSASSARWQDADYAGQAVQQQQQQQQHRLQQQRHPQHQRQCMDTCTAYGRAASSPATTTRDRRYTVAGDVTTAPLLRRAPFCEDGTDRQRAASSSSSSGGLPPPPRRQPQQQQQQQQHRHASRNHHRQHHHHSMLEFAPPPYLEMAADREDSGEDYRRSAFPSSWESSDGCLGSAPPPPPPPPHREAAVVSGPAASRLRPHQQRPLRADGGVSVGGGVEGGRGSFERRHSYHHHLSHEPGSARSAPSSTRPFSASPVDRSDGLGALSGGGGGGGGDAPFSLLRSASCRPITGERRQQQQSAGPSSLSVSSWDGRASLGEESAAGGTRMSSCNGAVGWSGGNRGAGGAGAGAPRTAQMDERYRSSSWVSGAAPAFDGHQALQQKQQQRWDHLEGIVHERETEDLAVKDHGWAFGHANTGSSGSSGNSGRDPAGFGMGHRDFAAQERQQQQQKQHRSELFSSAFAASASASASATAHPDVRRGGSLSDGMPTVDPAHLQNGDGARVGGAGGLVFSQTAARGHSISGDGFNPPPPGFAAAAAAGSGYDGGGVGGDDAGDGWIDTRVMSGRSGTPHDRQQQQQQQRERGGGGVDAVGSVADLRIDTSGLWESVSSGAVRGNGRSERQSSWPSAVLPPDSGAGAGLPASWGL